MITEIILFLVVWSQLMLAIVIRRIFKTIHSQMRINDAQQEINEVNNLRIKELEKREL